MENPLVSIITPMYNSQDYIKQTIDSVLAQTYTNWELFLIDDGSIDHTVAIAKSYVKLHSRVHFIQNKSNLGAAKSRNKGIECANGNYIAFLDADDLWKPNKLEVQISVMEANNASVSFSAYEQINELGVPLNILIESLPVLDYKKLLKSNYIGNLTGVYSVDDLGKITSPNLRKRQDWLLWLSAIKKSGKPAIGIADSLAYYRIREDSISANKINLLKHNFNVYNKGLGYSKLKSIFAMLSFLYEHFFIKSKQIKKL